MRQEVMITVVDGFRRLGLTPTPHLTWAAGARVRDEWVRIHNKAPPLKDNRRKTNGPGSHCFALYPESFWPYMEAIILAIAATPSPQPDLFPYRPPDEHGQRDLFAEW